MRNLIRGILTLLLISSISTLYAQNQEFTTSTVDVIGTAEKVLQPDQIMIQITIENTAESPKEAQEKTSETAMKTLSYLKARGNIKSIETNYVSLQPRRVDYNKEVYKYTANQSIGFVLSDIMDYQNVIIDLMERGVNGISQVRFESSQREKQSQELLASAMKNARAKAVFLARQLQQEVGKAVHIADRVTNYGQQPIEFKSFADAEEVQISVAPGELRISARVNVVFELK